MTTAADIARLRKEFPGAFFTPGDGTLAFRDPYGRSLDDLDSELAEEDEAEEAEPFADGLPADSAINWERPKAQGE